MVPGVQDIWWLPYIISLYQECQNEKETLQSTFYTALFIVLNLFYISTDAKNLLTRKRSNLFFKKKNLSSISPHPQLGTQTLEHFRDKCHLIKKKSSSLLLDIRQFLGRANLFLNKSSLYGKEREEKMKKSFGIHKPSSQPWNILEIWGLFCWHLISCFKRKWEMLPNILFSLGCLSSSIQKLI